MKRLLYILVVIMASFTLIGCSLEDGNNENGIIEKDEIKEEVKEKKTYRIVSDFLGDNGKDVVLNANTDSPVKKRLYKLPRGTYEVSTETDKFATFFIVKDGVVNTGDAPYTEELDYVSKQYTLTNGNNDLNGSAKKSVIITLNDNESINTQLGGSYYVLIFKEQ